jgi:putative DNA methylase
MGEGPGVRAKAETVIAWLWARTVKSPNPAVDAHVPLVRSFILSKKKGRECWAKPIVENGRVCFEVTPGLPPKGYDGTVDRRGAVCIISNEPIRFEYIRAEGKAGRMGAMLMAIITEGKNGRNYHSPDEWHARVAASAQPEWIPAGDIPEQALGFRVQLYGMDEYNKLFTPRQLVALTTFSDLVAEARQQAYADALAAGLPDDDVPLRQGGRGARAYAEAVSVYLAFAVDKGADYWSGICSWHSPGEKMGHTFGRQAIPMIWDYAEANPFSDSTGNWAAHVEWIWKVLDNLPASAPGYAVQQDAGQLDGDTVTLSTDPPYYDNIGYADLSDFFYVWLRRTLREVYPDEFGTLLVPKEAELIANPYRHGGKEAAKAHFEDGMRRAFANIRRFAHPDYPMTVYYAFKQQEVEDEDEEDEALTPGPSPTRGEGIRNAALYPSTPSLADAAEEPFPSPSTGGAPDEHLPSPSTGGAPDEHLPSPFMGEGPGVREVRASSGWETMLTSLIESGFAIVGTWPVRTELSNRMVGMGTNALASSIVLVCRPRPADAPTISRRGFLDALRRELPPALQAMQSASIAPVDLAQASIGPGMAVYSRHRRVQEADGTPISVRTALGLINKVLDEFLAEQDGNLDPETRFAVDWFAQFGFNEGEFGRADVLTRAKNTSVESAQTAGIVRARSGRVQLIHWQDYPTSDWDPQAEKRLTVWLSAHRLIRRLDDGELAAADLMNRLPPDTVAEARNLAYRLYNICEHKGWAEHARSYNSLVVRWREISDQAASLRNTDEQKPLFNDM